MKKAIPLKLIILSSTLFAFSLICTPVTAASEMKTILPQSSGINGWQLSEKYHYLPENLYNYINGAADLFVSYGFVKLAGAEYTSGISKQQNLVVDIYDMGSKLNAFGVFQSKRDPEGKSLKIGAGAFQGKRYVFFYKDRFYIEIQSYPRSKSGDITVVMAQKVAGEISGDCTPPSELNYLPDTGRVPGSEIYITGGILGHAFLDKGLVSDYRVNGGVVKAFVAFFPSRKHAVKAMDQYKSYLVAAGETWQALNGFGERGFFSKEPYHKTILVAQKDHFVAGVADLSHPEKGRGLLKSIIKDLKN